MTAELTPVTYELDVPMVRHGRPWTANDRIHWRVRHDYTAEIRKAVGWAAKSLRIGTQPHISVCLHYQPGDSRRRDAPNLTTTQKPAVDGLVDAGIVPDDTARYVTEYMPVLHPGKADRRLWLEVRLG